MASQEHFIANQDSPGETACNVIQDFEQKFDREMGTRIKQEAEEALEDVGSPFPFETEQAALKDNKDYQNLLRSLVVLEAQRAMALKDYETLIQLQREALLSPIAFVHKLQQKVDLGIPKPQKVAKLPSIAWENYSSGLRTVFDSCSTRHLTRRKYRREIRTGIKEEKVEDHLPHHEFKDPVLISHSVPSGLSETSAVSRCTEEGGGGDALNGQMSLPGTFNQPWSVEEQKLLEALLVKYPPERFESRRWVKIADELGNRTPQQVASRVQKYFIKLAKMSLPIPGRMPNLSAYGGKGGYHKHQRFNRFYYPSSTFMASYEPPVFMSEDDGEVPATLAFPFHAGHLSNYTGDLSTRPESTRSSHGYEDSELDTCQNMPGTNNGQTEQKCVSCGCVESSVWWQCVECPTGSILLCSSCSKQEFVKGWHNSRHLLNRLSI